MSFFFDLLFRLIAWDENEGETCVLARSPYWWDMFHIYDRVVPRWDVHEELVPRRTRAWSDSALLLQHIMRKHHF